MKWKILFCFILLLYTTSVSYCKLVKVIEITRHGGRTPLTITPEGYLQERLGQLTVLGYNQHLLLGQWNRKRYIENPDSEYNILSKKFHADEINVFSSRFQRTQFSAIGNISGMYPGVLFKIKTDDEMVVNGYGQPPIVDYLKDSEENDIQADPHLQSHRVVNINVTDKKADYIFRTEKCEIKMKVENKDKKTLLRTNNKGEISKLLQNFYTFDNKKSYKAFEMNFLTLEEKKQLKEFFEPKFGSIFAEKKLEEMSTKDFSVLSDYIHFFNFSYKDAIDIKPIDALIRKVTLRYVKHYITHDQHIKTINTPFIKSILADLSDGVELSDSLQNNKTGILSLAPANSKSKFVLYSAHDRNLQNFILSLFDSDYLLKLYEKSLTDKEAFDFLSTPFASSFIFELHQIDGDYYVRLVYNGVEVKGSFKKIEEAREITYVEGKGFPFKQFSDLLNSRIDKDIVEINC